MISFWNITSDKLNDLQISESEEKIIFLSDTERIFTDFAGKRIEYRDIVYVQDINNVSSEDAEKNLIYFDLSTKKLYFYTNNSYLLLNPDSEEGIIYIGKFDADVTITASILDNFVSIKKQRASKINDLVVDYNLNQWLKINNNGDDEDWIIIGKTGNSGESNGNTNISIEDATYNTKGLVSIKENCGLIIENGVLSLNILDDNRSPGQIVTLNDEGKIDSDIYDSGEILWNEI